MSDARSLVFPKQMIIDNWATVLGTMSRMAPQVMLNLFLSNPRMIDDLVRPTYRHLSALVQFIDAVGMHGSNEMRNVVAARLCATNAWHCMRTLLLKNQPSVILCTVCRLAYEMAQLEDDRIRDELVGAAIDLHDVLTFQNQEASLAACEALSAISCLYMNGRYEVSTSARVLDSISALAVVEIGSLSGYPRATLTLIVTLRLHLNSRLTWKTPKLLRLSNIAAPPAQGLLLVTLLESGTHQTLDPRTVQLCNTNQMLFPNQLPWFLYHTDNTVALLAANCLKNTAFHSDCHRDLDFYGVQQGCVHVLWAAAYAENAMPEEQRHAAQCVLTNLQSFFADTSILVQPLILRPLGRNDSVPQS